MKDRPDIIWIYCDELRADALGCYGNPRLQPHTPNLDRLASGGVRFTNNFCNSPVCVSSRCCALSGLYPEDTGIYNNEGAWKNFRLPRRFLTFPRVFADNGYSTANFGKIHVARGMYPGECPEEEIFQFHDGSGGEMGFWKHLGELGVKMIRSPNGGMNGGVFPDNVPYPPDVVTENALRWIDKTESPFLARISILQPHTPVLPSEKYVRLFEGQDPGLPECSLENLSAFERRVAAVHGLERMPPEDLRAARLHYYALVAWIDDQVGRVLDYLQKNKRLNRTVVVFCADHGNPLGDSGGFEKHTFTPTVHRVPLLVSWPGTVESGQTRDDICDSLDIGKTLFAMAGIDAPDQFKGRDLFADPAPDAIYSTIGFGQTDSRMGPNAGRGEWYGGRGWPRRSCIRTSRFRFDKNMLIDGEKPERDDEDVFLADVVADPDEMTNLAGDPQYSELIDKFSAALDRHAEGAVEVPHECLTR